MENNIQEVQHYLNISENTMLIQPEMSWRGRGQIKMIETLMYIPTHLPTYLPAYIPTHLPPELLACLPTYSPA